MSEILLQAFTLPFMQRALIAGVFIGILLASLGIFVLVKRMAFFGDGVAHASLAGIAIGLLAGIEPLTIAIVYAVGMALAMYFFEQRSRVSSDAIIGIFFTASLALGVILINLQTAYQPDLLSFLFGNILAITQPEAMMIVLVSLVLLILLIVFWRKLSLLVFDKNQAKLERIPTRSLSIFLYVALAVAIVLGVKLIGVILVSALLIVPPATSKLLARSYKGFIMGSVILSVIVVIVGLIVSYIFDLPSGAVIVIAGFVVFVLTFLVKSLSPAKKSL